MWVNQGYMASHKEDGRMIIPWAWSDVSIQGVAETGLSPSWLYASGLEAMLHVKG